MNLVHKVRDLGRLRLALLFMGTALAVSGVGSKIAPERVELAFQALTDLIQ